VLAHAARIILIFAALQVAGGHWLALQSVAWMGMLVRYSQSEPLSTAVEETFSGERPCTLCIFVQKGQSEEQKQQATQAVKKFDAVLGPESGTPLPQAAEWNYVQVVRQLSARAHAPPSPPPIA
jgi:hypothetical protein